MAAFDNLGQALRWLRSRQQRKQYEIAATAGITKAMLSAYETGKQNPSIETLDKILAALEVDLAELHDALVLHQGGRPAHTTGGRRGPVPDAGHPPGARSAPPAGATGLPGEWERSLSQVMEGFQSLLHQVHRQLEPAPRSPVPTGSRPVGPRRIEGPPPSPDHGDDED